MKPRRVVALLAMLVGLCLLASGQSFASQARIVRLSYLEGKVDIQRPGVDAETAVLNMPVVQGTHLTLAQGSSVEIEFENSSTLRAVGPASLTFSELALSGSGDKTNYIDLQPGTYYLDVNVKGDDQFRVSALDRSLKIEKSGRYRIVEDSGKLNVAVFKGELKLEGGEKEVTVKKSESLSIDSSDRDKYFLAKEIDPNPNDSRDTQRDQYRQQYSQAQSWKYANTSYAGPYSYGFTDLNYYGNYFNVPGYGWMWRPAYFDPSWSPWDNGAWAFYPGQGWMFVSMYPWGWAPYRYGQWMWLPSYGWAWRPGNRYNNWNAVPVVRNAPPNWHLPALPPSSAGNRTVLVNPAPGSRPWHLPSTGQGLTATPGGRVIPGPNGRIVGQPTIDTGVRGGSLGTPPAAPQAPAATPAGDGTGKPTKPFHTMGERGAQSRGGPEQSGVSTTKPSAPSSGSRTAPPRNPSPSPKSTPHFEPAPRPAPQMQPMGNPGRGGWHLPGGGGHGKNK